MIYKAMIFLISFCLVAFLVRIHPPFVERLLSPGITTCGKCKRPWTRVKSHSTMFRGDDKDPNVRWGMFALCEDCWKTMTPEQRLPYYLENFTKYHWEEAEWEPLKKAVLAGK